MTWAAFLTLVHGAVSTVSLSMAGVALGVPLGLLLALVRWSRLPALSQIAALYVSLVRSTPIVTFALFIFFVLPTLGLELDPIPAAVLTLGLNTAAFNCEIWRAALLDFPNDQLDAARAMGMSRGLCFRRIVFPQIWRRAMGPLVNEMTALLKASPAVAVIGVVEITRAASRIGAATYEPLPPFFVAALLYTAIVFLVVSAQRWSERHMARKYGFA